MARGLGVAFVLGAACHHPPPHHPGEEWLAAIEFEGNHALKAGDLREGLALHRAQDQGAAPDPYLVTIDGERIKGAYLRMGYLEVDVHSRVERHGDATTVIYKIDEGPRATTRVRISGLPEDPDLPVAKVREKLALKDGQPFDYAAYDAAKELLLGVVQDAGYAHATLDPHVIVDRANHEAIVDLAYDPGPKCKFGKIDIQGVTGDLADSIDERLALEPGQQFSNAAIAETQRAIYDMKRFSNVRVLPDKSDGDTIDVHISVSESARNEVSLGGGFGIDPATYEVRGRAGYSILGWPFPLYDFDIDLRPAYAVLRDGSGYEPRVRALATLTRMDLFYPFISGAVQGGYNYLVLEGWTEYGPVARVGVESPLGVKALKLRVGWEFQQVGFRRISPLIGPVTAAEIGIDHPETLGKYAQALVLDLRDSPIEPHEGMYGELKIAEGGAFAGGSEQYEQITPELRGYLPILNVVLAARARYGAFFGDIPPSERYYSGGATTQRGFSERRLAPTRSGDVNGQFRSIPIGGGALIESNIELRTELGKIKGMGVGGVVFLDGGDVTETRRELDVLNLNWAAGGGLRVFTLIGAVRADFGYRLNRTGPLDPEPGSHYAFHISIGEAY